MLLKYPSGQREFVVDPSQLVTIWYQRRQIQLTTMAVIPHPKQSSTLREYLEQKKYEEINKFCHCDKTEPIRFSALSLLLIGVRFVTHLSAASKD